MTRLLLLPLAPALILAACVPAGRPPEPPAPTPVARPAPPPPAPAPMLGEDWRDWPLTPGTWSYRRDARGGLALFGQAGTDAALTLRCDLSARQFYLSVAGAPASPATVRTSTTLRALTLQPTGGAQPYAAASLATTDPLLDAIAFSRGRFVVEQAGRPPLVVPVYAEIGRVIEDCRQ